MYHALLNEIYAANDLDTEQAKRRHLNRLQSVTDALWWSYRRGNINSNYSDPRTQEVYLLRYFIPYVHLLAGVLEEMSEGGLGFSWVGESLSADFYGSGPAPEIFGLLQHLRARSKCLPEQISVRLFDRNNNWSYARKLVLAGLLPRHGMRTKLKLQSVECDLGDTTPMGSGQTDLVVYQNCLNELNESQLVNVESKLKQHLRHAKKGATLVLIDRYGYSNSQAMLQRLGQWIKNERGFKCIDESHLISRLLLADVNAGVPQFLATELFDGAGKNGKGKRILAGKVDYRWLAVTKTA